MDLQQTGQSSMYACSEIDRSSVRWIVSQQWGQVASTPWIRFIARASPTPVRVLGLQSRGGPDDRDRRRIQAPRPACAVVYPELAFDPEFDGITAQTKSAPMRGSRHLHGNGLRFRRAGTAVRDAEATRGLGDRPHQRLTRFDRLALCARPCAQATLPRPQLKVGIVLLVGQGLDLTLRADLAVSVIPVKHDCGTPVGLELASLVREVIHVKNDAAGCSVNFLAEHDARRWLAARIDGREHHCVGIWLCGIGKRL